QGHLDRLKVSHFANENDIGILTKCRSNSGPKRMRVRGDLALVHDAVLVIVKEFDRILDRQYVIVAIDIDLIDHGGKRGRFIGSGRACNKHKAAWFFAKVLNYLRKSKSFERFDLVRNCT